MNDQSRHYLANRLEIPVEEVHKDSLLELLTSLGSTEATRFNEFVVSLLDNPQEGQNIVFQRDKLKAQFNLEIILNDLYQIEPVLVEDLISENIISFYYGVQSIEFKEFFNSLDSNRQFVIFSKNNAFNSMLCFTQNRCSDAVIDPTIDFIWNVLDNFDNAQMYELFSKTNHILFSHSSRMVSKFWDYIVELGPIFGAAFFIKEAEDPKDGMVANENLMSAIISNKHPLKEFLENTKKVRAVLLNSIISSRDIDKDVPPGAKQYYPSKKPMIARGITGPEFY